MIIVRLDLYAFPYEEMPGVIPSHPILLPTLGDQVSDWAHFAITELTNP
jgi:hypothetical protein